MIASRLQSTANILGALTTALHDEFVRTIAATLGHGESQLAALLSIGTRPGLTIASLSAIVGKQHSTTVRLVGQLELSRLVRREVAENDARRVELYLTAGGSKRFKAIQKARLEVLGRRLSMLSASDQRILHQLLDGLLESVAMDLDSARHVCRFCDHSVCRGAMCPVSRPFLR